PTDPESLDLLAKKMPADISGANATAESLQDKLQRHLTEIQDLYQRVIHAQKPMYYTFTTPTAPEIPATPTAPDEPAAQPPSNLTRFLDQRAPQAASVLARSDLRRS